jgi:hypothetical protein
MGIAYNTSIIMGDLSVYVDAANPRSYAGSGNTWYNLVTGAIGGTMVGVGYSTLNGGYFNFTGSQYMTFASTPPVGQSTLSSTVEIVGYRNSTSGFEVMFGGGNTATNQAYYFGNRQNSSNFMMAYSSNDLDTSTPTTNVAWNHYVATYDNATGRRVTYYNGALLGQNVSGVTNTSASVFTIGAFNLLGTPAYHFNGRIAFTKIYNRALTAQEVLQNYHATKKRYGL